jgi:large subunit ribosomal protein L7/L12
MANLEQLVEDLSALTILEATQLKTLLEEKWGVTAAAAAPMMMPGMMMGGAAAAAPAVEEEKEEQTEFNLILVDVGPKKINVIKAVRQVTSLGLKEAKDLVESTPATVIEAGTKDQVNEAKKIIEEEGAKVEIK